MTKETRRHMRGKIMFNRLRRQTDSPCVGQRKVKGIGTIRIVAAFMVDGSMDFSNWVCPFTGRRG